MFCFLVEKSCTSFYSSITLATEGDSITVATVESSGIVGFVVAASSSSVGSVDSVRKSSGVRSTALFFTGSASDD